MKRLSPIPAAIISLSLMGSVVLSGLFLTADPTKADTIFFLDNVTFSDGGTATGYFDYNTWPIGTNIATSPSGPFGTHYGIPLSGVMGAAAFSGFQIYMTVNIGGGLSEQLALNVAQDFSLTADNPLVTSPTAFFPFGSYEDIFSGCCDNNLRYIVTGSLDPVPAGAPGPTAGASLPGMLFIGAALVFWWRLRRSGIIRAGASNGDSG